MKTITIEGQLRTGLGKGAARQLRSQGNVPGVIYGGAKELSFFAPSTAFKTLVYTPSFQIAEVKLDGSTYRCILKDLQFDKVSDELIHVDLLELVEDKKVIASIPIKFTGVSVGVKAGGRLVTKMKALKVKTLPKYLKEFIEVKANELSINFPQDDWAVDRVVEASGGTLSGEIEKETENLDDDQADRIEEWLEELVVKLKREENAPGA